MAEKLDYTTLANRYTARFPRFTYVGTQVNFWIIVNLLLVIVMQFTSLIISETFQLSVTGRFAPLVFIAIFLGVFYGLILGFSQYYLDQNFFRKLALGKIILLKAAASLMVLMLLLVLLRYAFFDILILPTLPEGIATKQHESWDSLFWLLAIYYSFMTLLISFINQVNKKYGPGILIPLLLGQYRKPKEERRIFMFMDLKSSTTIAEKLGHLQYSAFIRDCFADINEVLFKYRAQVYQYVGDEIVITWHELEGIHHYQCLEFYFACQKQFLKRSSYYLSHYQHQPHFKAGAHTGIVSAVEIGEVKRDIAYHGDTLNTASRIQSVCNDYGKSFIVSKTLLDLVGIPPHAKTQWLGEILLKGKTEPVELVSVEWVE